ncbi:MAG: helix-turn-helix domain-containing protein [Ferruginibacter sp.]|nr:helix-turn-helix domain-containing protein [Bacteroidota bacterium]MBX2919849.1 helix-turn-helix domain-containing protein [Ferruginibacter sp.]
MIKNSHKKSIEKNTFPVITTYHFFQRKYGKELLLDVGRIESLKNFVLDNTPHCISFYEILFIEKGEGSFILDENKIPVEPCTVIFTSPGQIRRWNIKLPVKGYTVFFEKDFLNLFFADDLFLYRFPFFHQYFNPSNMKMHPKAFRDSIKLVNNIEHEFKQLQNDSSHLLRSLLYQLLIILNRYYATIYHRYSGTNIHPDFFRFRSLLEKEFIMNHRITDYSNSLKISANQLNKICRKYSGFSAQQLVHNRLITEIKRQLRSSKSIKEIVYEFEFSDPSNFNRFFKKITGTTAQQYRNNL